MMIKSILNWLQCQLITQMIVIVVVYLILQAGATIFLYIEYKNNSNFIQYLISAALAIVLYLLAHFRQPGYINSEKVKLQNQNANASDVSIEPIQYALIDKNFCRLCKQNQLLRMKHCYNCKKCVATYDHHCIWLDNCIGEKNRHFFYICIWANLVEIILAFFTLIKEMYTQGQWFPYQIVFLSAVGLIGFGVLLLTALHTYLMVNNLTTWESIRWEKIYYLVNLKKEKGSPFSRGFFGNIIDYWKSGFERQFKQWKFNPSALEKLKRKSIRFDATLSTLSKIDQTM